MFRVLDNGKPARHPFCKVHPSWDNCEFNTFAEAVSYTKKWLGEWVRVLFYI